MLLSSGNVLANYGVRHTKGGIEIELSERTIEAIDNGISLTFVCEFAVRKKWLFFSLPSQIKRHTFIVSRHALSERYLAHQDDKPTPAIFRSSAQSVAFLSKSVKKLYRSYAAQQPNIQLRVSLNKYELPAPMRLTAFTSAQWHFDSGWSQW